eukprot:gene27711-15940_t
MECERFLACDIVGCKRPLPSQLLLLQLLAAASLLAAVPLGSENRELEVVAAPASLTSKDVTSSSSNGGSSSSGLGQHLQQEQLNLQQYQHRQQGRAANSRVLRSWECNEQTCAVGHGQGDCVRLSDGTDECICRPGYQ